MKRFIPVAIALSCFAPFSVGVVRAQTAQPIVNQTTPFRDPNVIGDVIYVSGDELANVVTFNGTQRVTSVTFKYTSRIPINYTVRFYKLAAPVVPYSPFAGPLVKSVKFTNLPAGTNTVTRELTPEQQFDWNPTLTFFGDSAGGFYSVQMTRTDGSNTGLEAGFPLASPGSGFWQNLTTGRSEDIGSLGLVTLFLNSDGEVTLPSAGLFINISGIEVPGTAPVRLSALQLSTNAVIGGTGLTGTLSLTGIATEDTTVPLFSRDAVTTPATVTVPAGASSASFPITTTAVDRNGSYAIQATYAGKTVQQFLVVTPAVATLDSLNLSAPSVRGGTSLNASVSLSGPFSQARTVTISNSSNGSVVKTPATVTVPAGAQFVGFPITTSSVSSNRTVIIRATFGGKTVEQTLTVTRR